MFTLPGSLLSSWTLALALPLGLAGAACSSGDGDVDAALGGDGDDPGTGEAPSGDGDDTAGESQVGSGGATTAEGVPIVDPGLGGDPPVLGESARVHIVGDSTASVFPADDPTGRVGWGVRLPEYFDDTITIVNQAQSGRSSKSFYDEGFWGTTKSLIREGDYVFIQFGHNDEKFEDLTRYTDPATSYRDYLHIYIGESRKLGAFPILLTSISRLQFVGDAIRPTHGNYPTAVKEVAAATNTPVIDMESKTAELFMMWGPAEGQNYFATADQTHTNAEGAFAVAGLVAEGIDELMLPLRARLVAFEK